MNIMQRTKNLYVFDFDHNLMRVPSKIEMERYDDKTGEWVEEKIDSGEFVEKKEMDDYRPSEKSENPFNHFRKDSLFIEDFNEGLKNWPNSKGPSFDKFIRCLMNGDDLCIITARGQSPEVMRACLTNLILYTQETLELNKKYNLVHSLNNLTIYPVSSKNFNEIFDTNNEWDISDKKKLAFSSIVREKNKRTRKLLCTGFSDDDPKNIKAIKEVINEDLRKTLKNCHFVLYDTSNPSDTKKIKVTSKKKAMSRFEVPNHS